MFLCTSLCSVEAPSEREMDGCGVAAVQAFTGIADKTSTYMRSTRGYRQAAFAAAFVSIVAAVLLLGVRLSKNRRYSLPALIGSSAAIAIALTSVAWVGETLSAASAEDLLGADRELRTLTRIGLIPLNNPRGNLGCYLEPLIETYGRNRTGTDTAGALGDYPGVF